MKSRKKKGNENRTQRFRKLKIPMLEFMILVKGGFFFIDVKALLTNVKNSSGII